MFSTLILAALAALVLYLGYFWLIRRVVVGPGQVLVLLKKDGSRTLPNHQIVVPRAPDRATDSAGYATWEKTYGDCNGIMEQVYPEGTYFKFSPFDYEREIVDVSRGAIVPPDKVGIVVKKFGASLDPGQVMADPARDQRGPLPMILRPGRYNEYANPYAY
jgi:hypothetical protein